MKAELKFDLDDIDDNLAHFRCIKALDLSLTLFDIKEFIRSKLKYSEEDSITFEELQEEIESIFEKYNINLETLIN